MSFFVYYLINLQMNNYRNTALRSIESRAPDTNCCGAGVKVWRWLFRNTWTQHLTPSLQNQERFWSGLTYLPFFSVHGRRLEVSLSANFASAGASQWAECMSPHWTLHNLSAASVTEIWQGVFPPGKLTNCRNLTLMHQSWRVSEGPKTCCMKAKEKKNLSKVKKWPSG